MFDPGASQKRRKGLSLPWNSGMLSPPEIQGIMALLAKQGAVLQVWRCAQAWLTAREKCAPAICMHPECGNTGRKQHNDMQSKGQ